MKKIIGYLIVWLLAIAGFSLLQGCVEIPLCLTERILFIQCILAGIAGGVLYCLRGVYLNKCVKKRWDENWHVWYYLRPLTSGISGFVSCIFLKAGLLALEADQGADATHYGYLAIAFIAGYNVDNFMKKLEAIALTVWGIAKSRSSEIDKE